LSCRRATFLTSSTNWIPYGGTVLILPRISVCAGRCGKCWPGRGWGRSMSRMMMATLGTAVAPVPAMARPLPATAAAAAGLSTNALAAAQQLPPAKRLLCEEEPCNASRPAFCSIKVSMPNGIACVAELMCIVTEWRLQSDAQRHPAQVLSYQPCYTLFLLGTRPASRIVGAGIHVASDAQAKMGASRQLRTVQYSARHGGRNTLAC
jgi:hypothetical protein